MSVLDAARRLAQHEFRDHDDLGHGWCPLCDLADGHASDCLSLALPKIVAALEAAERVTKADPIVDHWTNTSGAYWCWACDPPMSESESYSDEHTPDCPHQALAAAMSGEVVPSDAHLTGTTT